MKYHIYALILGFVLDLIFGDPRILYHPICAIGNLISHGEKPFRAAFPKTEKGDFLQNKLIIFGCFNNSM